MQNNNFLEHETIISDFLISKDEFIYIGYIVVTQKKIISKVKICMKSAVFLLKN